MVPFVGAAKAEVSHRFWWWDDQYSLALHVVDFKGPPISDAQEKQIHDIIRGVSPWCPAETARRDGTPFLARTKHTDRDGYRCLRYSPMPNRFPAIAWGEMPWRADTGYWTSGFDEWMSLPS